jgi:hypothetical protein
MNDGFRLDRMIRALRDLDARPEDVNRAITVMRSVAERCVRSPTVDVAGDGGIVIEWHHRRTLTRIVVTEEALTVETRSLGGPADRMLAAAVEHHSAAVLRDAKRRERRKLHEEMRTPAKERKRRKAGLAPFGMQEVTCEYCGVGFRIDSQRAGQNTSGRFFCKNTHYSAYRAQQRTKKLGL